MPKPYTHGHCQARNSNNGVCPNHNLQCGWPECDRKEIVFQKPEVNELCGCGRPADYTANDGSLCCNKYGIKCKPSTEQTSPLFGTVVNEEGKIRGITVKHSSPVTSVPELAKIEHAAERHGLRQRREAVLNENECRAVLEYINRMAAQTLPTVTVPADVAHHASAAVSYLDHGGGMPAGLSLALQRLRGALKASPAAAVSEGDIDEAIRTGWRCAVVMARNVCVKRSNDWNDEDGSMDRINEANDCSKAIGQWSEPDEEYMVQMRAMLATAQETKS